MAEANGMTTASPHQQTSAAHPQAQSQSQQLPTTTPPAGTSTKDDATPHVHVEPLPPHPATSATDSGTGTRPRDARTVHMILSAMGVQAYQERVPLQLLDFAYRYTAGILSDAQHLMVEGYSTGTTTSGGRGSGLGPNDEVSLNAVRLAASSRPSYQFTGSQLSKESLLEMAAERNKVRLPAVDPQGPKFGLRLPHERFLLNGRGWGLNDEWESAGEDGFDVEEDTSAANKGDVDMGDGQEDGKSEEADMEDVFGGEDDNDVADRMED